MPRVVLSHAVEDVERWLEGKAERAAAIGAVGRNVTDYVALDESNKIPMKGGSARPGFDVRKGLGLCDAMPTRAPARTAVTNVR